MKLTRTDRGVIILISNEGYEKLRNIFEGLNLIREEDMTRYAAKRHLDYTMMSHDVETPFRTLDKIDGDVPVFFYDEDTFGSIYRNLSDLQRLSLRPELWRDGELYRPAFFEDIPPEASQLIDENFLDMFVEMAEPISTFFVDRAMSEPFIEADDDDLDDDEPEQRP